MEYALHKVLGMGFIALIGIAPQAHAQHALETIQSNKTVKIGVPVDAPPFGFIGGDQQPAGLDVDVAQLIAAKLGAKVQLVPVASAQRIPALLDKKVDLVVSTLGKAVAEMVQPRRHERIAALTSGGRCCRARSTGTALELTP